MAHPRRGPQALRSAPDSANADQQHQAAGMCVRNLRIDLPALVDGPDNRVGQAYTGWPDRLYVIDADGRVAHKSAAGPFGFKSDNVEATLKRLLP